jgi:GxxExxY protein
MIFNNRRGAETQRGRSSSASSNPRCDHPANEITERVIGACIEIHRQLGPGLLESAYEECLCHELSMAGLVFERQKPLPVSYKGVKLDCGYRLDLIVAGKVLVELKTVEEILPIHEAQLLTYLKLSGANLGLIINFNVPVLKQGVKRIVNNFSESSASPRLCG